ncbi:MAG: hypothetical protein K9G46_02720 [Flavobacteriales bacterium]|nr:hypothetical protein [Flavobacteriales bacterium]
MKYLQVCTKKKVKVDGEEKTLWFKVGAMRVTDKGTRFLTMFHQPDTEYHVFDMEEAEELPAIEMER